MTSIRSQVLGLVLVSATAITALMTVLPDDARGDGMPFPKITASNLEVRATAQRAVVWLRDSTWEVHIQPVFDREAGGAAWVVPWPVQPTIHESNADLFDHLELLTSPAFIEFCMPQDEGGGACGAADMGSNGGGETKSTEGSVIIWERGTVGQLDYVVLSAGDGDDLVGWLETNDYAVSTEAADAITEFETEDQFFFVATLSQDADPALPHTPVRFVLPDQVDGYYPLRLTGLAVPPGEALDLTLWVMAPGQYNQGYLPQSHPYSVFDAHPRNVDEFDADLDDFFAGYSADHLALLFSRQSSYDLLDPVRCVEDYSGPGYSCVSDADLGVTRPDAWAPELEEVRYVGGWVQRYQGRLTAAAMGEDLVFALTTDAIPEKSAFYFHDTGTCPSADDEYVGCSVAADLRHAGWFLIAAALLFLLMLGRMFRQTRS